MNKDSLSKLKLKNRSYHRYIITNDQQDCKTYAKYRNNQNELAEKP